jgi:hypothetical protein
VTNVGLLRLWFYSWVKASSPLPDQSAEKWIQKSNLRGFKEASLLETLKATLAAAPAGQF